MICRDDLNRMFFASEPDEKIGPREKWTYSPFYGAWILPYGEGAVVDRSDGAFKASFYQKMGWVPGRLAGESE